MTIHTSYFQGPLVGVTEFVGTKDELINAGLATASMFPEPPDILKSFEEKGAEMYWKVERWVDSPPVARHVLSPRIQVTGRPGRPGGVGALCPA